MNETFEELLERYKSISVQLDNENIKLEEAIKLYEESHQIYDKLNLHMKDAKVKINNIREKNV